LKGHCLNIVNKLILNFLWFSLILYGNEVDLLNIDFQNHSVSNYTIQQLGLDWNHPEWSDGVKDHRAVIAQDADNLYLKIIYPKDGIGPIDTGVQWQSAFSKSLNQCTLSFNVRFPENFDFVKGGKLNGLYGGEANTGGKKPTGKDGWSSRFMWRENGRMVIYVYHVNQKSIYGDQLNWSLNDHPVYIKTSEWTKLTQRVTMNSIGHADGRIEVWMNDKKVLDRHDFLFRTTENLKIDGYYQSTFFGGSSKEWATSKTEHLDFDNFILRE